jgi:uncharacterized protein (DUF885 family)
MMPVSRREALGALAATTALPFFARAVPVSAQAATDPQASALLETFADHILKLNPDEATSLGVDTGARASLRNFLNDRSAAGQQKVADTIRADLARADALDIAPLSFSTRTSFEVVRYAYRTALEGFAFPYGDVPVGTQNSFRNTPYVVSQNSGAYVDTPQFLETDHPIENAADAEAYLSRLSQYPRQLDGEVARMRSARGNGLVPPAFIVRKTIAQLGIALKDAQGGGDLVSTLVRKTKAEGIAGDWEARASKIVTGEVASALKRQIAELEAQGAVATDVAGMWSRPKGDEYYGWALRASTTTQMTPDEVHEMGLRQLAELHGRMDPILKSLGYTKGTVGERMQALAKDPK